MKIFKNKYDAVKDRIKIATEKFAIDNEYEANAVVVKVEADEKKLELIKKAVAAFDSGGPRERMGRFAAAILGIPGNSFVAQSKALRSLPRLAAIVPLRNSNAHNYTIGEVAIVTVNGVTGLIKKNGTGGNSIAADVLEMRPASVKEIDEIPDSQIDAVCNVVDIVMISIGEEIKQRKKRVSRVIEPRRPEMIAK